MGYETGSRRPSRGKAPSGARRRPCLRAGRRTLGVYLLAGGSPAVRELREAHRADGASSEDPPFDPPPDGVPQVRIVGVDGLVVACRAERGRRIHGEMVFFRAGGRTRKCPPSPARAARAPQRSGLHAGPAAALPGAAPSVFGPKREPAARLAAPSRLFAMGDNVPALIGGVKVPLGQVRDLLVAMVGSTRAAVVRAGRCARSCAARRRVPGEQDEPERLRRAVRFFSASAAALDATASSQAPGARRATASRASAEALNARTAAPRKTRKTADGSLLKQKTRARY